MGLGSRVGPQPAADHTLPEPLAEYLRQYQPRVREIGPVYAPLEAVLTNQDYVSTLAGADRYETARALFGEWASDGRPTAGTVLLGDGAGGADLLAAGALARGCALRRGRTLAPSRIRGWRPRRT